MTKKERHSLILEIISKYEISTQEKLTDTLIEMGYNVSQATVSRDINELNLVKAEGLSKKFKYFKPEVKSGEASQKLIDLLKQVTVSIENANNLIVLKTLAGNAGTAGMVVDQMNFESVIGTISGDDTLLIITRSNSDAEVLRKTLSIL